MALPAGQKQATVDRLKHAITQLEEEGRPVTTFTIKEVSRLDYMAYYRNALALALFRRHSTHLGKERAKAQAKRRTSKRKGSGQDPVQEEVIAPRDPLLHDKKARLVAEVHTARAERDQMEHHYHVLVQEHMRCGLTIARLEAQVAEHLAFLERFRSSLRKEEHEP